jgi:hypothetical protein
MSVYLGDGKYQIFAYHPPHLEQVRGTFADVDPETGVVLDSPRQTIDPERWIIYKGRVGPRFPLLRDITDYSLYRFGMKTPPMGYQ